MSNAFVVVMGIGTVFFGLICLILLSYVMSSVCAKANKPAPVAAPVAAPAAVESIPNRQAMIAAISAVIAEELGTDVSAIRILSMKKV